MVNIKEDMGVASAVPVNAMGTSSSVAGSGGIDTFDPLMKIIKRKSPVQTVKKKLRDIIKK